MNAINPLSLQTVQEASVSPFNLLEAAIELGRWELTLRPPDKMYGPSLYIGEMEDGMWEACERKPWSGELAWRCTGECPHLVMAIFREHLKGCLREGVG